MHRSLSRPLLTTVLQLGLTDQQSPRSWVSSIASQSGRSQAGPPPRAAASLSLIIKLLVDDVAVTQMYGNDLRPGTRDEGWHPTGHCGFSFLLDEAQAIAPGSVVRVLAGSDEVELTKSPWTFQPSGAAENT